MRRCGCRSGTRQGHGRKKGWRGRAGESSASVAACCQSAPSSLVFLCRNTTLVRGLERRDAAHGKREDPWPWILGPSEPSSPGSGRGRQIFCQDLSPKWALSGPQASRIGGSGWRRDGRSDWRMSLTTVSPSPNWRGGGLDCQDEKHAQDALCCDITNARHGGCCGGWRGGGDRPGPYH